MFCRCQIHYMNDIFACSLKQNIIQAQFKNPCMVYVQTLCCTLIIVGVWRRMSDTGFPVFLKGKDYLHHEKTRKNAKTRFRSKWHLQILWKSRIQIWVDGHDRTTWSVLHWSKISHDLLLQELCEWHPRSKLEHIDPLRKRTTAIGYATCCCPSTFDAVQCFGPNDHQSKSKIELSTCHIQWKWSYVNPLVFAP